MKRLLLSALASILSLAICAQTDYYAEAQKAYEAHNYELAMAYIEKQCETDCHFRASWLAMDVLYATGDYEAAAMLAAMFLDKLPKSEHAMRAEALAYVAVYAHEQANYKEAVKLLSKAIKESPDNSFYYYERGFSLAYQKKYDAALKDLNKSIQLNEDRIEAYTLAGICCQYKGNLKEMDRYFLEALDRTERKVPWVWCEYGVAQKELGYTDHALDMLMTAITLDPDNARTGRFYNMIQRDHKAELLAVLKQKVSESPRNATWEALLGDTYEEMDSLKEAYQHYRIASLIDPLHEGGVEPLKRLAKALADAEDYEGAQALISEALQAYPQQLDYRRLQHVYTYYQGDWAQAFELGDRLLDIDENQKKELLFVTADYLRHLGRFDEAMERCIELMKLDADNDDLTLLMAKLYSQSGKTAEAEGNYRILIKNADKFYDYAAMKPIGITEENKYNLGPFSLPRSLMGIGRTDDAREVVNIMNRKIRDVLREHPDAELSGTLLYNLACANAIVGLHEDALDMLERADKFGHSQSRFTQIDDDFETLRTSSDPDILMRWQQLLDRIAETNAQKAAKIHEAIDGVNL